MAMRLFIPSAIPLATVGYLRRLEAPDPGVGTDTVQDDAQYDGAKHSGYDGFLSQQRGLVLQHHDGKDNAGEPPWSEPSDEEYQLGF